MWIVAAQILSYNSLSVYNLHVHDLDLDVRKNKRFGSHFAINKIKCTIDRVLCDLDTLRQQKACIHSVSDHVTIDFL